MKQSTAPSISLSTSRSVHAAFLKGNLKRIYKGWGPVFTLNSIFLRPSAFLQKVNMGMNHNQIPVTTTSSFTSVRTRLYPANSSNPLTISTYFHENTSHPGRRYLFALDTLTDARTQPYVHDVVVTIIYRNKTYKFRVFFKRHKLLPINRAVRRLCGVNVEGDVLLAAVGKTVEIRNLRGGDERRAADLAVKKLMNFLSPLRTRRRFPAEVSV
ncbi:hypothetical protein VKT23_015605 [Stygiomarasmius scandens]|uniref:Uncharacterized protein n=1 Tax=Marasmiellus scandens TaxID=2682957 RepID=A0ABR1IXG8_9AGAR